ncbi:hypothetical protein PGT21_008685 [Puccinia graminis f. sp. tritici]|uniref:Uncharacterized protein n=1 Tax=Puccinia graminis f. sp. tritici TaxID=56615 RepID=A0A5B0MQZ4_PUCGR|nr:hypothetical protein PGT21_008685 [Puccinia graminis f. sp. tritici]
MNPWQPETSVTAPNLTAEQQQAVDDAVKARTQQHESMLAMLIEEVRTLKTSGNTSQPKTTSKAAPKPSTSKSKEDGRPKPSSQPQKKTGPRQSIPAPPPPATSMSTPKRAVRATSAPPEVGNPKPRKSNKHSKKLEVVKAPSPRRHPQQMVTGDFPPEFLTTKNALFVHIKILWGLLTQDSVPQAPDLQTLQEFYQRFSNNDQVEEAAKGSLSPALIGSHEVQLFKGATSGSVKFGRQVIHLGSNNIRYAQGLMVRLGLRVWCPNLEEDSASLYNAAHRIAAITTFQELVAGRAYNYMNVNPILATNSALIIQAYNHYVHFVMLAKYQKEKKEEGKAAAEALNKRVSKNRERLRDARVEFAVVSKFPKRYQDILAPIAAHSDDELDGKKGFYKIKTLCYRSKNASKFFRALDIAMKKAAEQDPSTHGKRRIRKLPKTPVPSKYTVAPKGLPIDFYDPQWYQQLSEVQQKTIPNTQMVAFLPNASESLQPKKQRHPDEKLKDSSFNRKYWDMLVGPYGLLGGDSDGSSDSEPEEGEPAANGNGGDDSEGEGHDLDATSPDVSEDEYLDEGEAGDLYDENFVVEDGEGEEDDAEEGEDEDETDDEDDEDWNEPSGSSNIDQDVHMSSAKYGVDQKMLGIMEEEEDGW